MKTKLNFKNNIKDWKWWYKIVGFTLGFAALIATLVLGIVNISSETVDGLPIWSIIGNDGQQHWDYDSNVIMFFSFFTIQSNLIVALWFLWATIFPQKEGKSKFLGLTGSLLVATYISITAIIWTTMLLPADLARGGTRPWHAWVNSLTLHVVVPLMLVFYVLFWMNHTTTLDPVKWLKKSWAIMIYPIIYGIVMLIRGEIRLASGRNSDSSYPYFFLKIHESSFGIPGYAWFIIALAAIIAIAVGFSTLYVWVIKKNFGSKKK